jgi:small subunit ribosomal protein S8e
MTQWKSKSKRGSTGKLMQKSRKKRRFEAGRDFLAVTVGKTKTKKVRKRGGSLKNVLASADIANIIIDGKATKSKILSVKDNPADLQFSRRNTITKGAVIETEAGTARVTSKPGQHGSVDAVLVKKE